MATSTQTAPPAEELVLPGWLGELLQPGVGQGVFTTLKLSLVFLVLTLCVMLIYIEDEVRASIAALLRSPVHALMIAARCSARLFTRRRVSLVRPSVVRRPHGCT